MKLSVLVPVLRIKFDLQLQGKTSSTYGIPSELLQKLNWTYFYCDSIYFRWLKVCTGPWFLCYSPSIPISRWLQIWQKNKWYCYFWLLSTSVLAPFINCPMATLATRQDALRMFLWIFAHRTSNLVFSLFLMFCANVFSFEFYASLFLCAFHFIIICLFSWFRL